MKKIELSYHKGKFDYVYLCTTMQSKTCREAKEKYINQILNNKIFASAVMKAHNLTSFEVKKVNAYFV